MQEELGSISRHRHKLSQKLIFVAILSAVIVILSLFSLYWFFIKSAPPIMRVPDSISQKLLFPVYRLSWLPDGYAIRESTYQEKDSALIFYAFNGNGANFAVTETHLPSSFDFQAFYDKNLGQASKITGTSLQTITGRLSNGDTMLSITAGSTWVVLTARNNQFDRNTLAKIVNSLEIQR